MSFGRRPVEASGTGAVGIGGDSHAPITVTVNEPLNPPARSGYLAQVRRLAPEELLGRETELAELAGFCVTADPAPSYVWWRAPAWAGKSALMSWFVLHPPPGVRVVSFFITARFAAQNDRVAFVDVLIEQLAHLLGEPMPTHLTEATRDAALMTMLGEAATACRERGERLILVVDGLDEDRGVTVGPDAYSIAALLPRNPPAGLRVIVAGRPNPPVPTDVHGKHPLRDPAVVRALSPSRHAEVVQADGRRELKRLLQGTEAERDLLGLLTAAAGGLSGADLAELTGLPEWEVEENLHAVSGRTFLSRVGRWREDAIVYVLGHEELQQEAVRYIGGAGLAGYRERLHTWANGYRDRQWPEETPEYLLRGYHRLLRSTGDLPRMLACAVDTDRHRRLLQVTGGDGAALGEIAALRDVVAGQPRPDLVVLARLAAHHTVLAGRGSNIPPDLPSVWVHLGRVARAEALARSISVPERRTEALCLVATALAAVGRRAEATAIAVSLPAGQAQNRALLGVAQGAVTAGDVDEAIAVVELIQSSARDVALTQVAWSVAAAGDADRAELITTLVADSYRRDHARADVARAVALTGDGHRALAIARIVEDPHRRRYALEGVARIPGPGPADLITAQNEALVIHNNEWRDWALADLVEAACAAGDVQLAEAAVLLMTDAARRDAVLPVLAAAVAATGDHERVLPIAYSIGDPSGRDTALMKAANAAAAHGNLDGADLLVQHLHPATLPRALTSVARVCVTDDPARASSTAERAEQQARSIVDRPRRIDEIALLISAAAAVGDTGMADALFVQAESHVSAMRRSRNASGATAPKGSRLPARGGTDGGRWHTRAVIRLALAAAVCGDADRAETCIARAVVDADGLHEMREDAYSPLALAMITAGWPDQALQLLESNTDPAVQERSSRRVANALSAANGERLPDDVAAPVELLRAGLKHVTGGSGNAVRRYRLFAATDQDPYNAMSALLHAAPVPPVVALAAGDWQSGLAELVVTDPAAVTALLEEYLSLMD